MILEKIIKIDYSQNVVEAEIVYKTTVKPLKLNKKLVRTALNNDTKVIKKNQQDNVNIRSFMI